MLYVSICRLYLLRSFSSFFCVLALFGIVWMSAMVSAQEALAQESLSISSFSPTSGSPDTATFVCVFGLGFNTTPGATQVTVNGVSALTHVMSEDMLELVLPPNTRGFITVTVGSLTATSATEFGAPLTDITISISDIWPSQGQCVFGINNGFVYVYGSGFVQHANNQPGSTVSINGETMLTQVLDSGHLIFITPPQSITGQITITNPQGEAIITSMDYTTAPHQPLPISLLRTTVDYAGGSVSVAGQVGSVEPCTKVTIWNETQMTETETIADPSGSFEPVSLDANAQDQLSILVAHPMTNISSTITDQTGATQPASTKVTVLENPSDYGNYPVGTLQLDNEGAFPELVGGDSSGKTWDASLAWARIMYPAKAGTAWTPGMPVLNAAVADLDLPNGFPVVLFLHANHVTCNYSEPNISNLPWLTIITNYKYFEAPICYPDPNNTTGPEDRTLRIPSHEGYNYLMERLASHGMVVVSVNKMRITDVSSTILPYAQGELLMNFLDMLREWNTIGIQNKIDPSDSGRFPFVGLCEGDTCPNRLDRNMFTNKLNLDRVGLSGHSYGGVGVIEAWYLNSQRSNPAERFTISAINNIAPGAADFALSIKDVPYSLIVGTRDGDFISPRENFSNYGSGNLQPSSSPKMSQYVYGANHKFFNTISTEERDLVCGAPNSRPRPDCACASPIETNCISAADAIWIERENPWVYARDDAFLAGLSITDGGGPISAHEQRLAAVRVLVPFFRWHLLDKPAYKEMLTGKNRLSGFENNQVFYTYQDGNRKVVDGFEYPHSKESNSLSGQVTANGFDLFEETWTVILFSPPYYLSTVFNADWVAVLGWSSPSTYSTELPAADGDIRAYKYLTLRVAEAIKLVEPVPALPRINLFLSLEDGLGNTSRELRTDQYDFIPQPYAKTSYKQTVLSSIRIPLEHFTLNGSNIDFSQIRKINIRMEGSGYVGIDDIEFQE